jgi:fructokinase
MSTTHESRLQPSAHLTAGIGLFVLGEALMDCVAQTDGRLLPLAGGSPYNLARAAALQDVPVHYLNPFSTDLFGQGLRAQLLADGGRSAAPGSPLPTALAIVQTQNGQPSYGFYREAVADRDYQVADVLALLQAHPPGVLHTGSLALMPPDHSKVLHIVQQAKAWGWTISLDVNLRPLLAHDLQAYKDAVFDLMASADWIKASDEDLEILGLDPAFEAAARAGQTPAVLDALAASGASRVALTAGGQGAALWVRDAALEAHGDAATLDASGGAAMASAPAQVNASANSRTNDQWHWQNAHRVVVQDTVGAGDIFWASCLADWLRHASAAPHRRLATLARASAAAAINCERRGCQPPSSDEIDHFLKIHPPLALRH